MFLSWGPYSGTDTFNIRYGPTNGNWLYNYNFTGFSTTINDLPENQPFWFQVAARNNCAVGTYGTAVLGGSPRLPNTGFGPVDKNIPWKIFTGVFSGLSILYLISTKS